MHKDKDIAAIYLNYQNSRTSRYSQERQAVLKVLKAHRIAIEQKTKQAVMTQVMNVVREKGNALAPPNNTNSNDEQRWPFLSMLRVRSFYDKYVSARPAWQYAVPILAVGVVLFGLLPQLNQKESSRVQVALTPQNRLIESSEQLAPLIQTISGAQFGFSNTQDAHTTAFNLGVVSVDLPILAHANDHTAVNKALLQIYPAARSAELNDIEEQVLALKSALEKSSDNKIPYSKSIKLSESLKKLAHGNHQQASYEFGQWLETSLLASFMSNNGGDSRLLKQQLKNSAHVFSALQNSQQNDQTLNRLLTELDTLTTGEITQISEIRALQHKLNQIKAFLKE